jgi:hypothetical protein
MTSSTDRPSDEAILQFERRIKDELTRAHPLVGTTPMTLDALAIEYETADELFRKKSMFCGLESDFHNNKSNLMLIF